MRRLLTLVTLCAATTAIACTAESPKILSVSIPGDTRDTAGPYVVQIVTHGVTDDDVVQVRYTVDEGVTYYATTAEQLDGRNDLWGASLPGQPQGTTVSYYVRIMRDGKLADVDPVAAGDAGPVTCTEPDAGVRPADGGRPGAADAGRPGVVDGGMRPDAADFLPADGPCFEAGFLYSFRVLSISGACIADSECKIGLEICSDGTCRAYSGSCVGGGGPDSCPDGYACDDSRTPPVCAIAPRPCDDDRDCPAVEECNLTVQECRARAVCSGTEPCVMPAVCHLDLGLCFAS